MMDNDKKCLVGKVLSVDSHGNAKVQYFRDFVHAKYGKRLKLKKVLRARCLCDVNVGDSVAVEPVRPISKTICSVIRRVVG